LSSFPQLAVGAVVRHNGAVLLIQRATPPNAGQWAIPGGKVHPGETLQQAAEREIREETGIIIRAGEPLFCFDVIEHDEQGKLRFHYVIVDLAADYIQGEPLAADDAQAAAWIRYAELGQYNINATTRQLLERLNFSG
jgi:ADP-ribose pyrophosphatase